MQEVDFNLVSQALQRAEASVSASECHGMLTAQLSVASGSGASECVRHIFDDEVDTQSILFMEALKMLEKLLTETQGSLNDVDIGFTLLLPDEEEPIEDRLSALAEWCQGFLFGLGLAGLSEENSSSDDVKEFMQDLVQIGNIDLSDSDESEQNEQDFSELVEYVRIGVLYLQEECNPVKQQPSIH